MRSNLLNKRRNERTAILGRLVRVLVPMLENHHARAEGNWILMLVGIAGGHRTLI